MSHTGPSGTPPLLVLIPEDTNLFDTEHKVSEDMLTKAVLDTNT